MREAAWSFPTFKTKATNAKGEFDADTLTPEEMDALLDYAFERYYSDQRSVRQRRDRAALRRQRAGDRRRRARLPHRLRRRDRQGARNLPSSRHRRAQVQGRPDRRRRPGGNAADRVRVDPIAHPDASRDALPVHADDGADRLAGRGGASRARSLAADAGRRRSAAAKPRARARRRPSAAR